MAKGPTGEIVPGSGCPDKPEDAQACGGAIALGAEDVRTWIGAEEAANRLGVKRETLYAYVSRGLLRKEPGDGRRSQFRRDDVERLVARGRKTQARRGSKGVVIESAITFVDDGALYYHGVDAVKLARLWPIEAAGQFIWDSAADGGSSAGVDPPGDHRAWEYPEAWAAHLDLVHAADAAGRMTPPLDRILRAFALLPREPAAFRMPSGGYDCQGFGRAAVAFEIDCLSSSKPGAPRSRSREGRPGDSLADRIAYQLLGPDPSAEIRSLLRTAVILSADHGLAVPTMCVRLVASVGADPLSSLMAGMCAIRGSEPGTGFLAIERFLAAGSPMTWSLQPDEDDPCSPGRLGFTHTVYDRADPRAEELLSQLRVISTESDAIDRKRLQRALATVEQVQTRTGRQPNIDFALATFAYATHLPEGSSEAVFCIGRSLGWIGHLIEAGRTSDRYRLHEIYTGPGPS
ncbi:citrate synthase [Acidiferrimicrobium sp. IK]|uniref:citrate synthase n=1 Tax=Acidiferrimicrobium sp. IK TaxID=2871700 RepID=UPI0021CB7B53|nr:citrate synthase [Acidiferrimicrobium sp. IK]MCU4186329.1 citrate synthase [Acidiferrimicrobium sp. IK]